MELPYFFNVLFRGRHPTWFKAFGIPPFRVPPAIGRVCWQFLLIIDHIVINAILISIAHKGKSRVVLSLLSSLLTTVTFSCTAPRAGVWVDNA